jgi:predicted TPR repeat methyltransferase
MNISPPNSPPTNDSFEAARQHFVDGISHFEAGRYALAQTDFEASLALLPERASTLGNLGATHMRLGQPEAALPLLERALALEPDDIEARSQHGLALAMLGHPLQALASFDEVLRLVPSHIPALYQRCMMLSALQRHPDALLAADQLLALDARSEPAWWARADTLHRLDRHADALAAYDQLLAINPLLHKAWSQRGGILKDLGRTKEAAAAFRQALSLGADPELTAYFLAALPVADQGPDSQQAPPTAPRAYVEALFDDYADQFDGHLVGQLGYRAHLVLIEHLLALPRPQPHFASALDLGCGTGLCGPLVKSRTGWLEGVDLSALMLEKARSTGAYDHLAHADLSDHLTQAALAGKRHDLVLSADVFIYVGALEAVFAGVNQVMAPGGIFCFSVESAADAVDYALTPGMRYAHSARYLRQLAASTGFTELAMLAHPIRHEQRHAIDGLFVYLLRPA